MAARLLSSTSEYDLFDSSMNYPPHKRGRFAKHGAMTIITAKNEQGSITFHSVEPRAMTQEEIDAELAKWCVNPFRETIDIITIA